MKAENFGRVQSEFEARISQMKIPPLNIHILFFWFNKDRVSSDLWHIKVKLQ